MSCGVPWTRQDVIIAYALYCITPLNKIRVSNTLIQQVSQNFSHSTNSLVLRMQNFAAIDPNSGIKGAAHVAKLDKLVFAEFKNDWGALSIQAEKLTGLALFDADPINGAKPISSLTNKNLVTRERQFFRASVFASYNNTCCISGMTVPALLIASHIKPYNKCRKASERVDPENGLLLNSFYDRAFDRGLITITKDLRVFVASEIKNKTDSFTQNWLVNLDGEKIKIPARFLPAAQYLEYHNDLIFRG